jgi:protoporphyrinogen oxidase
MGILFNSSIFANRAVDKDHVSITCIVAMDSFQSLTISSISDEPIKKAVEETILLEVDSLLRFAHEKPEQRSPVASKLVLWPQAIPIYSPALSQRVIPSVNVALKRSFPNINIFGNFTGEVSVRGMCKAAHHWSSLAVPSGL